MREAKGPVFFEGWPIAARESALRKNLAWEREGKVTGTVKIWILGTEVFTDKTEKGKVYGRSQSV